MPIKKPIRLYWGENYAEKPAVVKKAIDRAVSESLNMINLYPGEVYQQVVDLVASQLKVKKDQIIFGQGIEGLIHLTSTTFFTKVKVGGMFQPSFFVFENNLKRGKYVQYPCHYATKVDLNDFLTKISKTDLFFLASPNTATGNYLFTHQQIERILKIYRGILVVDECYLGIGKQTAIDLVDRYDNLLIYRGLTKVMGLGGLRLAFALGQKKIIDRLKYHLTKIELDPINIFSLKVFLATFPYFDLLAENTNRFIDDYISFMRREFPQNKLIRNVTTLHFMDIKRYQTPVYQVINFMNKHGYIFSEKQLRGNREVLYPEFITLTPPPKPHWQDFANTLRQALK